jgi:hypothetical protein
MQVPIDGRRQYSMVDMAIAHGVGGVPLERFEQISPTAWVVRGSWPKPAPTQTSFSGAVAASQAVPDAGPRSSAGALALWPNLK